jgi:hypothetical protein
MDDEYVIGIKRERRDDVPADWREIVRGTSGVEVTGDASPVRLQIRASPEAVARLRERLSVYVHIEKVIRHYPSGSQG